VRTQLEDRVAGLTEQLREREEDTHMQVHAWHKHTLHTHTHIHTHTHTNMGFKHYVFMNVC